MMRFFSSTILIIGLLVLFSTTSMAQTRANPQQHVPELSNTIDSIPPSQGGNFAPATTTQNNEYYGEPTSETSQKQSFAPSTSSTPINQAPEQATPSPASESALPAEQIAPTLTPENSTDRSYSKEEINREVMGFFENGSKGLAKLVARAFQDFGQPVGYIKGNEAAGAAILGFRYGEGELHLKSNTPQYVYWQSPSVGFDLGVNASKTFTLIYGMENPDEIYQRFPGIDGSAYIVGGFGMNYQRYGNITLVPIRFGAGLRLGANVGYQHFTKERTINPF
ncbi:DUF1134 domain-containing protein [Desulfovibrio inopinatus]|uniref:DUF1134 domain-containing protein n=1 Tax=Desulfovibrio inopinatus TaxID=102109 RepID=UPI0003FDD44C|nr:DUF1134 domain-containing protein [Desulfovibrio inopinatus]